MSANNTESSNAVGSEEAVVCEETEAPKSVDNVVDGKSNSLTAAKDAETQRPGAGQMDSANLHYDGDLCIYTHPETKYQYQWDKVSEQWTPRVQNSQSKIGEAPTDAEGKNYVFDGETYTYKDDKTGTNYRWNVAQNKWVVKEEKKTYPRKKKKEPGDDDVEENDTDEEEEKKKSEVRQDMSSGHYDYDGENHTYTDPKDGTVYFWDRDKNAWFPKVDDDFMAKYQMSYGFVDNQPEIKSEEKAKPEDKDAAAKAELKRKAPQEPQWFELDERMNTKVYVSNLPLDITEQEFVDLMSKCGLIMRDVDTGNMKVKLYHEPGNPKELKGDGLCTYIKRESVELALNLLDGSDVHGNKIKVEKAQFELKGAYDPTRKPKKRRRKDKEKIRKAQEKLFDWRPDKMRGERSKHERTIIIKNLFDPSIFDTDVGLILEYQQDLREEGSKCGNVRKVIIYDRHPEGVAQITFKEPEEADACVQLFNNRWFNKRRITAETWDGKTKYRIAESTEETEARLAKWTKYLESEEGKKAALEANHHAGLDGKEDNFPDSDEEEEKEKKGKKIDEKKGVSDDKIMPEVAVPVTNTSEEETFKSEKPVTNTSEKETFNTEKATAPDDEDNDDAHSSAGNSDKTASDSEIDGNDTD